MAIRKRTWRAKEGTRTAWVVDYFAADPKTGERKRHLRTFKTEGEARKWWEATAAPEIHQGTHTPASTSATVAEAWLAWLAHGEAEGLERATIRPRREHLRLHVNPLVGHVKLAELTAPGVHAFLDALRDAGRSLAMRRKVLTSLKTMLTFAQGRGMVAQNVARGIRLSADRRAEAELREGVELPTKAELRAMVEAAGSIRERAFVLAAMFTGMRASELRGLRWEDVDLDGAVIRVRQRADAWGAIGRPKSKAGRRDIPLAPIVVNTLREWWLACPKGEAGLVFPNGKGNVELHGNILKRLFGPLQVRAGIVDDEGRPRYGLHALRHAAASLFIEQGWQPKKVQTVLGHAGIAMTFDLYGKLFKDGDGDRAAMARVETAVLG